MRAIFQLLIYVIYCVEGGIILAAAPWTWIWEKNYFFQRVPWLRAIGVNAITRGLVSGVGVALILHGLHALFQGWRQRGRGGAP